ncbi:hypothetical protein JW823_08555 [bacterium]|nr:hypothetical protein [candidate division CSSED10-310 bacterium]
MEKLNRTSYAIILILLTSMGYISARQRMPDNNTEPQRPPAGGLESGQPLAEYPAIPLYITDKISISLQEWIRQNRRKYVVAILNRRLPDHFAQWHVLERIARDSSASDIGFVIVNIQRLPSRLPICYGIDDRHHLFSTCHGVTAMFHSDPTCSVILFIDMDMIVTAIEYKYLDYQHILNQLAHMSTDTPLSMEGETK